MTERGGGLDALTQVGALLAKQGRDAEFLEEERTYRMDFGGPNGDFLVYVRVPADVDLLLCYSAYLSDVPVERRVAATELVTRLNYGLRLGNFELSLEDGELRFKSSLDLRGIELTDRLLSNVLMACVNGMSRYLPSIRAFVEEGRSATEAIALVEGAQAPG